MTAQRITPLARALWPVFAWPFLSFAACTGEPPVLSIGEVEYSESDLLTFNATRRTRLAEVTAFGLAVARGETEALGEPLMERRGREALLEMLQHEVALQFAGVGEEALRARYEANPGFELTVRHLVILVHEWAPEGEVERTRQRAEAARERILSGEPFSQVAAEVSEEPAAAERGGLLRPGREGTWVDAFWTAANALDIGGVSPVIRTPYGFHVLTLEGREPVPFPEARAGVVEEVAGLLPSQDQALRSWTDSVTAPLAVDSARLGRVWEESGSLFTLALRLREEETSPVAGWPGGSFTGSEFAAFLFALERAEWEYVLQGGLPEVLRIANDAARRAYLAGIAGEMGIALTEQKSEALKRDWYTSVATWSQGLGFREGLKPDDLKEAALEAIASSAQGARIARDELHARGPMLLAAYPIGP